MRIYLLLFLLFLPTTFLPSYAQSVPTEELIRRIKINRTLFHDWDTWPSLKERASRENRDIVFQPIVNENFQRSTDSWPEDQISVLGVESAAKHSDAVVIGHVVRNISALTPTDSFVITDSELVIDEVWKENPALHATDGSLMGQEITVVSPGGLVRADGHLIDARLPHKTTLARSKQYLLFLRYVPASQSYIAEGLDGFDVSEDEVVPVHHTEPMGKSPLARKRIPFLQAMHASVERALSGGSK